MYRSGYVETHNHGRNIDIAKHVKINTDIGSKEQGRYRHKNQLKHPRGILGQKEQGHEIQLTWSSFWVIQDDQYVNHIPLYSISLHHIQQGQDKIHITIKVEVRVGVVRDRQLPQPHLGSNFLYVSIPIISVNSQWSKEENKLIILRVRIE